VLLLFPQVVGVLREDKLAAVVEENLPQEKAAAGEMPVA